MTSKDPSRKSDAAPAVSDGEFPRLLTRARRHLARRDPVLAALSRTVGPCTLRPNPDGFSVLVHSIISQMISTKAAIAIGGRLANALGPAGLAPEALLALGEADLRQVGLSANKARSLRELAERVREGTLPLADFPGLADEEVVAHLVSLRGVGVWTAQMFLIFSLGRPDVLAVDDLGLRMGVKEQYDLPELPGRADLKERAEVWRPYRSIATWYFWRSRGGVPQSD
jgi:DNA-3-methyladenine glycosylase II